MGRVSETIVSRSEVIVSRLEVIVSRVASVEGELKQYPTGNSDWKDSATSEVLRYCLNWNGSSRLDHTPETAGLVVRVFVSWVGTCWWEKGVGLGPKLTWRAVTLTIGFPLPSGAV